MPTVIEQAYEELSEHIDKSKGDPSSLMLLNIIGILADHGLKLEKIVALLENK